MRYLYTVLTSLLIACGAAPGDDDGFTPDSGEVVVSDASSLADGSDNPDAGTPTCQADLENDSNNCGFCGHVCTDSSCVDGFCFAQPYSNKYPFIAGVMTDNAAIYFNVEQPDGSFHTVRRPFSGSDTFIKTVRGPALPRQVSMDLGNVYHTDTITSPEVVGRLLKTPKTGSSSTIIANFQPSSSGAIAFSEGVVYWATVNAEIRMLDTSTGDVIPIDSTGDQVKFITQDATDLYWITYNGRVGRTAKDGSSASVLATSATTNTISVDGAHVYWKNSVGMVKQVDKDTGADNPLVTGEETFPIPTMGAINSTAVVSDGIVYWSSGTMLRAKPLSGGPTRTLGNFARTPPVCPVNGYIEELWASSSHIFFTIVWYDPCGPSTMQVLRAPKY